MTKHQQPDHEASIIEERYMEMMRRGQINQIPTTVMTRINNYRHWKENSKQGVSDVT